MNRLLMASTKKVFFANPFPIIFSLLIFCFSSAAQAQLPYCSDVFHNGLQTHGWDGSFIHFGYNSRLLNGSTSNLSTPLVTTNPWSPRKSCGGAHCTASGVQVLKLYEDNYRETGITTQVIVPPKKTITIGNNGSHFGLVQISEWGTAVFSSTHQEYVIDRLHLGYKSSVRLPAGTYWIRDLQMEVESRIDVIGEGTVNLYLMNSPVFSFNTRLNANTKDPAKLAIHMQSSSIFDVNSQTYGFVITENEMIVNHNAKIVGGVVGQFLILESENDIIYDAEAARKIFFRTLCRAGDPDLNTDITPPEIAIFGYDDPAPNNQFLLTGNVIDPGPDASGLAEVFLQFQGEGIPLHVDNGAFVTELTLSLGENVIKIIAKDVAGNESQYEFSVRYPDAPTFVNVMTEQGSWPQGTINGEIHALWPLSDLSFTVDGIGHPLTEVAEGIYEFSVPYTLEDWRHRVSLIVTTPIGDIVETEIDWMVSPPIVDITFDTGDLTVTTETVVVTGSFAASHDYPSEVAGIVIISDQFPGVEFNAEISPGEDRSVFSAEVPLAIGTNFLTAIVREASHENTPWQTTLQVMRNE